MSIRGTAAGGARCPEAAAGTLRTRRPVPTGVCTVQAATDAQTPVRTGSPVYKVRPPPPCLVAYGNRPKTRWAVYAPGTSCTETVPSPAGPCTEIGEKRARQGARATKKRARPAGGLLPRTRIRGCGSADPLPRRRTCMGPKPGRDVPRPTQSAEESLFVRALLLADVLAGEVLHAQLEDGDAT